MQKRISALLLLFWGAASSLFAQGEAPPSRGQDFIQVIVLFLVFILFFYFIMWRPEQKRRKLLQEARDSLKKGDKVTAMGIVGTVMKIQEHTVILRMVDGSQIEVIKPAITDVMPGSEEEAKKSEKKEASP